VSQKRITALRATLGGATNDPTTRVVVGRKSVRRDSVRVESKEPIRPRLKYPMRSMAARGLTDPA
jgi:hypothetical protein